MTLAQLETALVGAQRFLMSPTGTTPATGTTDTISALPALFTAPGTAGATFDSSSSGAWPRLRDATTKLRVAGVDTNSAASSTIRSGGFLIVDRLWGCSGYSAIDTALKSITTSLPRGSGAGVMCFAEIYTAIGATPQNVTVTYTNQAGTGSRTGTIAFNAASPAGIFVPMQMRAGDYGINSIQSFQLGGSTGTAGDYGLTLVRPVMFVSSDVSKTTVQGAIQTALPTIDNGAALMMLTQLPSSTPPRPIGYMRLVDG